MSGNNSFEQKTASILKVNYERIYFRIQVFGFSLKTSVTLFKNKILIGIFWFIVLQKVLFLQLNAICKSTQKVHNEQFKKSENSHEYYNYER